MSDDQKQKTDAAQKTKDTGKTDKLARAETRRAAQDSVSGTHPAPVSPGLLLFGLFAVFGLVAGALLLANHVSGVAAFVDASFFQVMFSALISLVIGVFVWGFTRGATASMGFKPMAQASISFGGALAAVGGFFLIILPNLTPTTALTVYLRDAQQTGPAAPAEFTVPEGVEVVFQLEEGRAAKTVITEGHFGLLPKGVDLPVTLSRGRWGLAGIDPSKCSASGGSAVKAGCRVIWLRLQPSESARFTRLADLPPTGLAFSEGEKVTLQQAVDALASELQTTTSSRDPGVYVTRPDWPTVGPEVAGAQFPWHSAPAGAKACVLVRLIEQSFNAAHSQQQIFLLLTDRAIQIQTKTAGEGRPDDTCR